MRINKILGIFCFLLYAVEGISAEMTYIYNAPESALDKRYQFHWAILETALKRTTKEFGAYRMVQAELMSERRQVKEMLSASGKITVMYLDSNPDFEGKLTPVRIPVDKNLVGYRVFLIRKQDKFKFENIQTLNQLRAFTYGQGLGWIDVKILEANHFTVVSGSSYEGLFNMLAHGRFDVFPRGAVEILGEYESHKKQLPDLFIEPNIILYYPLPMYFWFSNNRQGKELAKRAAQGMYKMIDDGSYDTLFEQYHGENIRKLQLNKRKIFRIDNPLLGKETPFNDKRLWFEIKPSSKLMR